MNYYPHHIGDYLRDTAHLSATEDGIYRRMLDWYYASEKPLPLDFDWLCKLLRIASHPEREIAHGVLHQFFKKFPEGWRNKRADQEIRLSKKRAKVARTNGKLGGRPITQRVIPGLAKHNPEESYPKPNPNPKPITKTKEEKATLVAALPDWLPLEAWQTWLEVRSKKRVPNTQRALNLAVRKLEELKAAGHDPLAVLENAAVRGWSGLFPPPQPPSGASVDELIRKIEEEDKQRAAH